MALTWFDSTTGNWRHVGPFFWDGTRYVALMVDATNVTGCTLAWFTSTDPLVSWTQQETITTAAEHRDGPFSHHYDGTYFWAFWANTSKQLRATRWDGSATSTTYSSGAPTSEKATEEGIHCGHAANWTTVAYQSPSDKIMGTNYTRLDWTEFNRPTTGWGSTAALDDGGENHYQTTTQVVFCRDIPVTDENVSVIFYEDATNTFYAKKVLPSATLTAAWSDFNSLEPTVHTSTSWTVGSNRRVSFWSRDTSNDEWDGWYATITTANSAPSFSDAKWVQMGSSTIDNVALEVYRDAATSEMVAVYWGRPTGTSDYFYRERRRGHDAWTTNWGAYTEHYYDTAPAVNNGQTVFITLHAGVGRFHYGTGYGASNAEAGHALDEVPFESIAGSADASTSAGGEGCRMVNIERIAPKSIISNTNSSPTLPPLKVEPDHPNANAQVIYPTDESLTWTIEVLFPDALTTVSGPQKFRCFLRPLSPSSGTGGTYTVDLYDGGTLLGNLVTDAATPTVPEMVEFNYTGAVDGTDIRLRFTFDSGG